MGSLDLLILLACVGVLHGIWPVLCFGIYFYFLQFYPAAYSTYEHLSRLKALGQPEGVLPFDIIVEVLLSLLLGIVGANFGKDSNLKDISWRTEMRKRPIEQMINPSLTFPEFKKSGTTK